MKSFFSIILFLQAGILAAQPPRPPVTNFTPKNYGTQQTPDNYSIFQDNRGYIFAGNSGGLLVFDGHTWNFTEVQAGSYVTAIDQAPNGRLYVGTNGGEFGYVEPGEKGKMKFHSLLKLFGKEQNVSWVLRLYCVNQDIYLQTTDQLFYIHQNKVQVVPTDNSFHLVFKTGNRIFARERGVGLIEVNGTGKKVLSDINEFKNYGLFGVLPYDQHQLLVITQERGLWLYNEKNHETICLNRDSLGLKKYQVYGGIALHDGKFALNSLTGGVLIINHEGQLESRLNKSTGLRVNDVKQVVQDKHHNLWMALSNGIALVNYSSPINYFDEEAGLLGGTECMVLCNGVTYAGTSEGLFSENTKANERHFYKIPEINSHVWDMVRYGEKVIVASDEGIFIGNEKGFTNILGTGINTLCLLEEKNQLAAAGKEAFYLIDLKSAALSKKNKVLREAFFEFSLNRAQSLKRDPESSPEKNILWLGTVGNGLIEIELLENETNINYYNNLDDASLVSTRPVVINKKIYFATTGGLRQLEHKKNEKPFFDYAGILPELESARINDILQPQERIWVCADNKLYYIHGNKTVKTPFTPIDRGRINNVFPISDRICWIAAADGLIRYTEPKNVETNLPFDIALRRFTIGNDSLIFAGNWMSGNKPVLAQPEKEKMVFPYRYNTTSFTFSALYFSDMDKITWSHQLEGHDNDWSSWSTDNKIKYTNLHEGEYVLKVKAKNAYGIESPVFNYTFTVLPPWYRTMWAYIGYGLAALLLFYLVFRLLSLRLKRRNEQLEIIVKKRTEEIARKNEQLHAQYEQITHQKKEITDSINYAKKIQEAMMPFVIEMKKNIPHSFVLFKPKDIVSGDFYWYGKFGSKMIIICADCTGHGVPGAFMSMLCIDKLNHIIAEKKIFSPDKILEEANKSIKKSLGQTDEQNLRTKDGMDCAVMMLDNETGKLYYAGANRPLWYIRNNEIEEVKPDKCAIGGFTPEEQVFTLNEMAIEPGDCFYASTDGYADQFGGPKGKKLMVKTFKESLLNHFTHSFEEQHHFLDTQIEDWKAHPTDEEGGPHEQIDDICVVGFKIT